MQPNPQADYLGIADARSCMPHEKAEAVQSLLAAGEVGPAPHACIRIVPLCETHALATRLRSMS
jgi:hypothetical protein